MQTMPTPSAALGTLTVAGAKIYYADGSVVTIKPPGNRLTKWRQAGVTDIQVVLIFFDQTYQIWIGDTLLRQPYRHLFHGGAAAPADYYWFDGTTFGAGLVTEVPPGLPAGAIKTGSLLLSEQWRAIYNTAKDDMVL